MLTGMIAVAPTSGSKLNLSEFDHGAKQLAEIDLGQDRASILPSQDECYVVTKQALMIAVDGRKHFLYRAITKEEAHWVQYIVEELDCIPRTIIQLGKKNG